jgi:hypothetical protein
VYTQSHKYILFLLCLCILQTLQANLESRLYSKDQFSHAYLSVTIEQFHFAFGVSLLVLNHIKTVFTHLFTNFIRHIMDVQIQANQRLWLCIDPGRGVLFTIISANLACIKLTKPRAKRLYSTGLGLTTAYSSLPFCPDISVYK